MVTACVEAIAKSGLCTSARWGPLWILEIQKKFGNNKGFCPEMHQILEKINNGLTKLLKSKNNKEVEDICVQFD